MTINTTKMFLAAKWKWIQTFLICFLMATSCFSEDNKNPLLAQTTPEYWLEKFKESEAKYFDLNKELLSNIRYWSLTENQLKDCVLSLAKAIKTNPSPLISILINPHNLHNYYWEELYPKNFNYLIPEEEIKKKEQEYKKKIATKQDEFNKFLFETILEAISQNNTIKWVNLSWEGFIDKKIPYEFSELFLKMLKDNKTVKNVTVIQSSFSENDVLKLAEILRDNKTLEWFNLEGLEKLTAKGEKALLEAFKYNKSMKTVNLFPISRENNDAYFNLIKENKSLVVRLNKFDFSKEEELKYVKAVSSNPDCKFCLSPSAYDNFSIEGKKALLKALHNNKSMKSLKFPSLSHELSESFFELIKNNTSIERINIENCEFYEEEVLELAKALSSNSTIKEINLKSLGYHLTLKGKNALREAEDKRSNPGWFSFGKKEPLVILLPEIPDNYLNQNRGR